MVRPVIYLTVIILAATSTKSFSQETLSFTDSRDGKIYKTIQIGSQIWMAENLAYSAEKGCWAYNNEQGNVSKYGYLYNWEAAQKVCPNGYHLPSEDEWIQLELYINLQESTLAEDSYGNWNNIKKHLKATSGWENNGNGSDKYGFFGLPGGNRHHDGKFYNIGALGLWWSNSSKSKTEAWSRYLYCSTGNFYRYGNKRSGYSVRCVKD